MGMRIKSIPIEDLRNIKLGVKKVKRSNTGARPGTGPRNGPGKVAISRPEYIDKCLDYMVENRITTIDKAITLGNIANALALPEYVCNSNCRTAFEALSLVKFIEVGNGGWKKLYYLDANKLALVVDLPPEKVKNIEHIKQFLGK